MWNWRTPRPALLLSTMLTRTPIVGREVGREILPAGNASRSSLSAVAVALVFWMLVLAGCATATTSGGPTGRISIDVVPIEPDNPLFDAVLRARAVSADGAVDAQWRIQDGAPVEVPSGRYRLEAFTVFLSDYIVCADPDGNVGEPGSTPAPGSTCFQPTLGPGQVCSMDALVPPRGEVRFEYRMQEQGGCELVVAEASPT